MAKSSKKSLLRVGQRVLLPSTRPRLAEVIEDRGFLAGDGGQIVRIRTLEALEEARHDFELRADVLTVVE